VLAASTDRPVSPLLPASCCVAANWRFGPAATYCIAANERCHSGQRARQDDSEIVTCLAIVRAAPMSFTAQLRQGCSSAPGTSQYDPELIGKEECMSMWRTGMLALIMFTALANAPADAAALDMAAVNAAAPVAAATKAQRPSGPVVIKAQVLLDRAGFSPGEISGRLDENTRKAIAAFQASHQLPINGQIDPDLWKALGADSADPVLTDYVITPEDVRGPFLEKLPAKFEQMKNLGRLSYTGPRQELAERFHMSQSLLSQLNSGKPLDRPGTMIVVVSVAGERIGKVVRIEIDKPQHLLRAFGPDDKLVAVFPASIGSAEKPAPSGTFKVTSVTHNPTYRYDPAYAFKGVKANRPFTIKPGPNNPVGTVWIGLTDKGYGIHGTPDPSKVGKTASHGCIRLTNWDAEKLASMVSKGVPVAFLGASNGSQGFAEAPAVSQEDSHRHGARARPHG
jgi:lipoprotein-anchoring transpeptidase ErfK/SrfK